MDKIKKVSEFEYRRVTFEEIAKRYGEATEKIKNAKSAEEVLHIRNTEVKSISCEYETFASLAYMRYTCNTKDEFYIKEQEYYDEIGPMASGVINEYCSAMLNSPYRKELEEKLGKGIFKKYEFALKSHSEEIVKDEQEENAVVMEYSKLMSQMKFLWNGEEAPMAVVRGKLQDSDREVRRKAAFAIGEGLSKHAAELDDIYDRLVKIRDRKAKKMGYKNYVEMGYYAMSRVDYDRDMIEAFRANVVKDIVPAVAELKNEVAKNLGIKKVTFYDDAVFNAGAQPEPILDPKGILDAGVEMYREMSDVTGDFMDKMMAAEAFDVLARDGKWGGGYCIDFPVFDQPFILANFNGSSGDVDVITHEYGHALAMNFVHKYGDFEMNLGGNETAECHSMSMEFFSWKFMDKFFGNETKKYLYKHLCDSFSFLPYGCMVDEFQHIVYENPALTPSERKAEWLKLEEKYRPYLNITGIPYIEQGTRWQYQMHIYETPFYYIDYCLAQTVALSFLVDMQKDYDDAFARYIAFSEKGGTKPFPELVAEAKLPDPFGDGSLKAVAEGALKIAQNLK